jgi:hypothetical protein
MSGPNSVIAVSQTRSTVDRRGLLHVGKDQQCFFKGPAVSGCLAMLAILGVVLIHTINLGSDAPKGLPAEQDYGIYVDEGYKTLSARNMDVFGTTRWHPLDEYHGWLSASPVTQGLSISRSPSFVRTRKQPDG